MVNARTVLLFLLGGALAGEAAAQDVAEAGSLAEERARATEQRSTEREVLNIEAEMRAAEARLEEAARHIAELSTRRLPRMQGGRFAFEFSDRPLLGITIDGDSESGPAEGVHVNGVTPGGPAADAGLQAGDIVTAINGEALGADNTAAANRKLLDFMQGVEDGDTLDLEYLRDGKVSSLTLTPRSRRSHAYAFGHPGRNLDVHVAPSFSPAMPGFNEFVFLHGQGGWGDMEMVVLTEELGRYFGTDKGLLVVRAPSDENLKLKDGDVIHTIDGREPTSVSHAVRILGSYQAGEALKIEIMRDKRRQTLDIEMPDNRRGGVVPQPAPDAAIEVSPVVDIRRVRRIVER